MRHNRFAALVCLFGVCTTIACGPTEESATEVEKLEEYVNPPADYLWLVSQESQGGMTLESFWNKPAANYVPGTKGLSFYTRQSQTHIPAEEEGNYLDGNLLASIIRWGFEYAVSNGLQTFTFRPWQTRGNSIYTGVRVNGDFDNIDFLGHITVILGHYYAGGHRVQYLHAALPSGGGG